MKSILFLICLDIAHVLVAQEKKSVTAELNKTSLEFTLDENGSPHYAVYYNQKPVVLSSRLGFTLSNAPSLENNFELLGSDKTTVDETWQPVWGEVSHIRNHYQQLTVRLKEKNPSHRQLTIVFRVFEDGVGFRYEFPKQPDLRYFVVSNELTEFRLAGDHQSFWIPGDYDSNEYPYTTSKLSEIDAWKVSNAYKDIAVRVPQDQYAVQTPLMLKTADGLYINIHEAALVNYSSMQLRVDRKTFTLVEKSYKIRQK